MITGVLAGTAALAGGGLYYIARPRVHPELALARVLERLHTLDPRAIETDSAWEVARVFHHLAQGVDFSLTGYPELKSGIFRHTVGRVAFNVFQTRGQMRHDTSEPIPGEAVQAGDPVAARDALIASLTRFDAAEAELSPHFAYGQLGKAQYAQAHAMHINDHLSEFRVT